MRTTNANGFPRVDYELTALGHSLKPHLELLAEWAQVNQATIEQARITFDQRSSPASR
ncbi:winged helix-turn-helix transcriptional regulator [Pseudomonas marginalis]|uniref:winged helix-turn-helix transcriptional regulator n=2 Tax=Pseudomonas TaxID=286 RepID=UPI00254FBF92|nr:winged helix-turn-helix transcriptional regulator [Pseudomonas marginalis]